MTYPFDRQFLKTPVCRKLSDQRLAADISGRTGLLVDRIWAEIWAKDPPDIIDRATFMDYLSEIIVESKKRLTDTYLLSDTGFSEKDMVLIAYGDHIRSEKRNISPLRALGEFCRRQFFETEFQQLMIHLLPVYASPYRDGGFDVSDPFSINREMGTWEDIHFIRRYFLFALDFVANHMSVASDWFQKYLAEDPLYRSFFIGFENEKSARNFENRDLPKIRRPRSHNPLIPVKKPNGATQWVYMTFSDHQADVNYRNPFVFLKMSEIILFYILQGAGMIRLDAIPYLWKQWGTSCVHHPTTHLLIQLFRSICESVNPGVKLLAESMEPLADSRKYLSTKMKKKAHIAYNFVPCGLIPHTLLTEDATVFMKHMPSMIPESTDEHWAVVCGITHDGSSLNPCRTSADGSEQEILSEQQIENIGRYYFQCGMGDINRRCRYAPDDPAYIAPGFIHRFRQTHGKDPDFVNYKSVTAADGEKKSEVYEVISTYASLFTGNPDKIIAALSMALPLPGVPFIYLTALFALSNDYNRYLQFGNPRELNRGRIDLETILEMLVNSPQNKLAYQVFSKIKQLMKIRLSRPEFHPHGSLIPISTTDSAVLSYIRTDIKKLKMIWVVQNVSCRRVISQLDMDKPDNDMLETEGKQWFDLISETSIPDSGKIMELKLEPWALKWFIRTEDLTT